MHCHPAAGLFVAVNFRYPCPLYPIMTAKQRKCLKDVRVKDSLTSVMHCYPIVPLFSLYPSNTDVGSAHVRMSGCSAWTPVYHLKHNLSKIELLFIPGKDCPRMDLSMMSWYHLH